MYEMFLTNCGCVGLVDVEQAKDYIWECAALNLNIKLILVTCMYVCVKNLLFLVVVYMADAVQILYSHTIKHTCL